MSKPMKRKKKYFIARKALLFQRVRDSVSRMVGEMREGNFLYGPLRACGKSKALVYVT